MKVIVGNQNFPSKKALYDRLRQILWGFPMGSVLSEADSAFLTEALRNANVFYRYPPEYPVSWRIQQQAMGSCPEFVFSRSDGTCENPSIKRLSLQKSRAGKSARMGARRDIAPQIVAFRMSKLESNGMFRCDDCSIERAFAGDFEVDHKSPDFVELFEAFLYEEEVEEHAIKVVEQCDATGIMLDYGMEEPLAQRWRHFHAKHATLQLLCKLCHRHKTYDWGRQS